MKPETLERVSIVCDALISLVGAVRDETSQAVSTSDHVAVIRHFDHVRKTTTQIKEAREALDEMEQRLSREQVPDVMRAHGIRNTTIEGVGRVQLNNRWSCSMIAKGAAMDWLRESGYQSLIQETVNSQTLAAFAKDLNETKGTELPQDIFKTSIMTYTSITKA